MGACGGGSSDTPTVTEVRVEASAIRMLPEGSVQLVATVSGTGKFDPGVAWAIESGGGSLSSEEGSEVTYSAPAVEDTREVVIRATSRGDSSRSSTLTLIVSHDVISNVMITAVPTRLAPGETASLVAFVEGYGVGREVTWKLVEGAGQLSQKDYRSAEFVADASATGEVVLEVSANEVPSRTARVTLTVSPKATELLSTRILSPGCETVDGVWLCSDVSVGDSAPVFATILPAQDITAVARIPGLNRDAPLSFNTEANSFRGTLSLVSLDRGQYPLEVVVSDTLGNSLVTPATFVLDRPPRLEVTEPTTYQLAVSSSVRIRATCADDATECRLTAGVQNAPAEARKTGTGSLDAVLELPASARGAVPVHISAEDALGQFTTRTVNVFVAGPSLEAVATVPGQLVDAADTRLLFTTGGGPSSPATGVGLLHRDTTNRLYYAPVTAGNTVSQTRLTSIGMVFAVEPQPPTEMGPRLYEYHRDAAGREFIQALAPNSRLLSVKARGEHVIGVTHPEQDLMLWNINTRATVNVARVGQGEHDVAENGMVAFMDAGYDIVTYQGGTMRQLTSDPDDQLRSGGPVTDGTIVAYHKVTPNFGAQTIQLAVHTGEREILLTEPRPLGSTWTAGTAYAVKGGWVAYTDLAEEGHTQVWLRSPTGETRPVSSASTTSSIEALGPEGRIAVRTVIDGEQHLLVSGADGALRDLGAVEGRAVWLEDAWHVLWADTLFRVR